MSDTGWTITLDGVGDPGAIDPDQTDELLALLAKFDAAVSLTQDGARFSVTLTLPDEAGTDPVAAVAYGMKVTSDAALAAGMPGVALARVELITNDELDAALARPAIPELVGVSEIADILGVSRQRAHQLTKREDFPAMVADLAAGPVWTKGSLTRFVEQWHLGKPDVSEEVEMIDMTIAELKRRRNELMHGPAGESSDRYAQVIKDTLDKMETLLAEIGRSVPARDPIARIREAQQA